MENSNLNRGNKKSTKKAKGPKKDRYRHMMYVQQVGHLPDGIDSLKELVARVEKKIHPMKYAAILHDKDKDGAGNLKAPNIHLMMSFENARSINSIAKLIGDKPQYIEKWDQRENNGYSYLVHATNNAKDEYQYLPDEVIANFDYKEFLKSIKQEIDVAKANLNAVKPSTLLDLVFLGEMTKKEAEEKLTGSQYGNYYRQLEKVDAKRLEREAEKWREEMRSKNETVTTFWIYGEAGTGKTRVAKKFAGQDGEKYYFSGSSRDIFQNYSGEHVIILDELRPKTLNFEDLLKIIDPYSIDNDTPVLAPARYVDKTLACKCFIITSPYSPSEFYNKVSDSGMIDSKIDGLKQLLRRITIVQKMTENEIFLMKYDGEKKDFVSIEGTARPNPYAKQESDDSKKNVLDIYESLNSVRENVESAVDIDLEEIENDSK